MRWLGSVLIGWGIALLIIYIVMFHNVPPDDDYQVSSRIRYPNEEALAQKACGSHKLMSWWISDPRKNTATMHVRCAGVVTMDAEVKF